MVQLVKESAFNVRDLGSIPGLGRSSGEGKGYPLQYSGLENSMDSIVHGVTKSQTRLSDLSLTSQAWACCVSGKKKKKIKSEAWIQIASSAPLCPLTWEWLGKNNTLREEERRGDVSAIWVGGIWPAG